jgi:cytochrome c
VSSSVETAVVEKIDIAALMAMGDIAVGEKVFKKCAACHSIIKGGKNNIGPALWNVVVVSHKICAKITKWERT